MFMDYFIIIILVAYSLLKSGMFLYITLFFIFIFYITLFFYLYFVYNFIRRNTVKFIFKIEIILFWPSTDNFPKIAFFVFFIRFSFIKSKHIHENINPTCTDFIYKICVCWLAKKLSVHYQQLVSVVCYWLKNN